MVDMVENILEAARTVTRTAEVLKEYEGLRAQFNNVLDLLLPGDGHDLLPLHGQDWPALKDQVIGWMAEGLQGSRCTGAACGRPSGPGPGGWTSRPSTCWTITDGSRPPRSGPTRMTPPWPWSGSGTAKTACATGRATRPASPDRTEGEPLGSTDRSRWLPRPGGR